MRVKKFDTNEIISIRKNVEYLGTDVLAKFPQFHTVTECDTTSFLQSVGKTYLKSYHQMKSRCCNLLSVFFIKFMTGQE